MKEQLETIYKEKDIETNKMNKLLDELRNKVKSIDNKINEYNNEINIYNDYGQKTYFDFIADDKVFLSEYDKIMHTMLFNS